MHEPNKLECLASPSRKGLPVTNTLAYWAYSWEGYRVLWIRPPLLCCFN